MTRRAYLSFENGDSNFRGGKDDARYEKLCDLLEIVEPNFEEERIKSIQLMKQDIQILKRMIMDLEKQLTFLEEV